MTASDLPDTIAAVWRGGSAKIGARVVRIAADMRLAEDSAQDALAIAL